MTILFAYIFTIWFLLTLLQQFNTKISELIYRYDVFCLIPTYHFFAPKPIKSDYHLIYRLCSKETSAFGHWLELPFILNDSNMQILWHPKRRNRTGINSTINVLLNSIKYHYNIHKKMPNISSLISSAPFMAIKKHIEYEIINTGNHTNTTFQFAIVKSSGFTGEKKLLFLFTSTILKFGTK